jgi:hypothetical protein
MSIAWSSLLLQSFGWWTCSSSSAISMGKNCCNTRRRKAYKPRRKRKRHEMDIQSILCPSVVQNGHPQSCISAPIVPSKTNKPRTHVMRAATDGLANPAHQQCRRNRQWPSTTNPNRKQIRTSKAKAEHHPQPRVTTMCASE